MSCKPEIGFYISGNLRSPPIRIVVISRPDCSTPVHQLTDRTQMIASIEKVYSRNLFTLCKEPLRHRPATRISFLTQLPSTPHKPFHADYISRAVLLHDFHPPSHSIVTE